ncbi:MAG: SBBP repeat-containing protein, partial [Acidobacteriota bacterium]|nr:SBBP repeat-containing protein [Acidobacteriota bacterium]
AVDNLGNAYVTGNTESENFPVVRPVQSSLRGDNDIFIAKIDPAGMALIYSTYLGSTFTGDNGFDERGLGIAVDNFGSVYVTGQVLKNDFLIVMPEQPNYGGGLSDAFICKISTPDILTLAPVSAASFTGPSLAPEEIVAVFGANLASGTEIAQTVPLPTSLLGSSVKVKDKNNADRTAPLFFVSPGQINFQIPAGTAEGKATITVTNTTANGQNVQTSATVLIEKTAPGLFAANANGKDVAAAIVVRVKSDGSQTFEPVAQLNAQNILVPIPIDFGPASDQLFLILFGTGWRNRSAVEKVAAQVGGVNAPVLFAGAQGSFLGEDQINLQLPRSLAGSGETIVAVTVDGQSANLVTVAFR